MEPLGWPLILSGLKRGKTTRQNDEDRKGRLVITGDETKSVPETPGKEGVVRHGGNMILRVLRGALSLLVDGSIVDTTERYQPWLWSLHRDPRGGGSTALL